MKRWFTKQALPPEEIERQCPYSIDVLDTLDESKVLCSYAEEDDAWIIEWMSTIGFAASAVFVEPASFGASSVYAESLPFAQTTSAAFIEHLACDVPDLAAGSYRIGWSFEWWGSNTATDFIAQVLLDGSVISTHRRRPVSSAATTRDTVSGFHHAELARGNHSITLEYRTSDGKRVVGIENARIECWRVG